MCTVCLTCFIYCFIYIFILLNLLFLQISLYAVIMNYLMFSVASEVVRGKVGRDYTDAYFLLKKAELRI